MKKNIAFILISFFLVSFKSYSTRVEKNISFYGDGKSPKTAYKVYSIADEYEILALLNKKPTKQTLSLIDGCFYDIFEVDGKNIYFMLLKKDTNKIIEI